MCGLLAIFRPGGVSEKEPRDLLGILSHRGPDASAVWFSDDRRLALGHARLKVIDLSDDANQPMTSPDGRWTLIYNGEMMNYRTVRAAYRGPWQFRTASDTEVLLATFTARGAAALHDWVGMFAFLLFDHENEKLHLVRDRFGIKPLYWTRLADGGVAIASEIPPLLKLIAGVRPDQGVIRTYLEIGQYDICDRTFFEGIRSIEPGCAAQLDLRTGELAQQRWYRLADHVPDLGSAGEAELAEHGAQLVETAIRDHLVADVGVGLNVSGGVDSSVLARVSAGEISDLHAFTQDFEPPYSEAAWARRVSAGAKLHICTLTREDIEARIDATVRRQAEPFGGVTVIGYDRLYEDAGAAGLTVLLDGNGVDEGFLGYSNYAKQDGASVGARAIDGTSATAADAVTPELKRDADIIDVSGIAAGFDDPAKAGAARDLLATKIPRGLRFNDRMSMGRSKELRVPFLDHRLVEFGFGVPTRFLLANGRTKALFRRIAQRWVPAEVANAEKRSVQSPQREWLAGAWQPMVRDILQSPSFASRGWVDPVRARSAYEAYLSGNRDNSFFIWQWVNLELWARAYLH
jgi:asparagine synthase (glutamine-hydrolysing)